MTKQKFNLYSLEDLELLNAKADRRVSRLFFFIIGVVFGLLLTVILFMPI